MAMQKMKKRAKAKWVKALRSGKYKQTDGTMRYEYWDKGEVVAYCCLGVAREVCALNGNTQDELDPTEMDEIGLSREAMTKLINFNDDDKYSFKWIASYIERYL